MVPRCVRRTVAALALGLRQPCSGAPPAGPVERRRRPVPDRRQGAGRGEGALPRRLGPEAAGHLRLPLARRSRPGLRRGGAPRVRTRPDAGPVGRPGVGAAPRLRAAVAVLRGPDHDRGHVLRRRLRVASHAAGGAALHPAVRGGGVRRGEVPAAPLAGRSPERAAPSRSSSRSTRSSSSPRSSRRRCGLHTAWMETVRTPCYAAGSCPSRWALASCGVRSSSGSGRPARSPCSSGRTGSGGASRSRCAAPTRAATRSTPRGGSRAPSGPGCCWRSAHPFAGAASRPSATSCSRGCGSARGRWPLPGAVRRVAVRLPRARGAGRRARRARPRGLLADDRAPRRLRRPGAVLALLTTVLLLTGGRNLFTRAASFPRHAPLVAAGDRAYQRAVSGDYEAVWRSTAFLRSGEGDPGAIYVFGDPLILLLSGRSRAASVHGWAWDLQPALMWATVERELRLRRPPYIFVSTHNEGLISARASGLRRMLRGSYTVRASELGGTWYELRSSAPVQGAGIRSGRCEEPSRRKVPERARDDRAHRDVSRRSPPSGSTSARPPPGGTRRSTGSSNSPTRRTAPPHRPAGASCRARRSGVTARTGHGTAGAARGRGPCGETRIGADSRRRAVALPGAAEARTPIDERVRPRRAGRPRVCAARAPHRASGATRRRRSHRETGVTVGSGGRAVALSGVAEPRACVEQGMGAPAHGRVGQDDGVHPVSTATSAAPASPPMLASMTPHVGAAPVHRARVGPSTSAASSSAVLASVWPASVPAPSARPCILLLDRDVRRRPIDAHRIYAGDVVRRVTACHGVPAARDEAEAAQCDEGSTHRTRILHRHLPTVRDHFSAHKGTAHRARVTRRDTVQQPLAQARG